MSVSGRVVVKQHLKKNDHPSNQKKDPERNFSTNNHMDLWAPNEKTHGQVARFFWGENSVSLTLVFQTPGSKRRSSQDDWRILED